MTKKRLIALIAIALAVCCAVALLCYFIFAGANKSNGHVHKMIRIGEKPATCTADGREAYYICGGCDKWFKDEEGNTEITDRDSTALPKGHKLTHIEGKDGTCTEGGNREYYACGRCDKWFEDEEAKEEITDRESILLPKAHKLSPVAGINPTCTEDGNKAYYTCGVCDKWFEDSAGEAEIIDKTSVVLEKGHKLTPVRENDATCIKDGNKLYFSCGGCGKWFEDKDGKTEITDKSSVVLKKLSHNFKDKVCTECGMHTPTEGLLYIERGSYVEVVGIGDVTDTEIFIADEYNGKAVTTIGYEAFSGCNGLMKVTIPDSVTTIGSWAFDGCYALKNITLPDGLTYIGEGAFYYCTDLQSIDIPDGVTTIEKSTFEECRSLISVKLGSGLTTIGARAFSFCVSLKEINLPYSLTSVGEKAFYSCSLPSLIFSGGLISIGNSAFHGCEMKSIIFPASPFSIGDEAFSSCIYLESMTIPYGLISIGEYAFEDCESLKSVTIPDSVTSIGMNAFIRCVSLKSATISASLTVIETGVFEQCHELTSVTIRSNVTAIKKYAFYECYSLKSITIPGSVTYIGENAFGSCTDLVNITFTGTTGKWKAIEKVAGWDSYTENYTIHCTDGDIDKRSA